MKRIEIEKQSLEKSNETKKERRMFFKSIQFSPGHIFVCWAYSIVGITRGNCRLNIINTFEFGIILNYLYIKQTNTNSKQNQV